jgi:hypothetical protein
MRRQRLATLRWVDRLLKTVRPDGRRPVTEFPGLWRRRLQLNLRKYLICCWSDIPGRKGCIAAGWRGLRRLRREVAH